MSVMCSMKECATHRGMCGHEMMMLVVMVMLVVGGVAYWVLA